MRTSLLVGLAFSSVAIVLTGIAFVGDVIYGNTFYAVFNAVLFTGNVICIIYYLKTNKEETNDRDIQE